MQPDRPLPIIELNVSDENEIGFKLKIEGSDKDLGASKPNVRFVVTETSSGKGWIFSAAKSEDGVVINVPVMKGIVTENSKYHGKLEVILGGRYFTPTEVDIQFIEPLKVEAAVVSSVSVKSKNKTYSANEHSQAILEESTAPTKISQQEDMHELSIESEIDSIIVKESVKEVPHKRELMVTNRVAPISKASTPIPASPAFIKAAQSVIVPEIAAPVVPRVKRSYVELNATEKEAVNKLFLEKCSGYNMDSKEVKRLMSEGTSITKKKLTALLAMSVKEYLNG